MPTVPPESATALGDALIALLTDPDRRRSMGEEARRRASERFAIDRIAAEHLELLGQLTAGSFRT